jgi:glycosyltransferase involved in cell wall biosynthesis
VVLNAPDGLTGAAGDAPDLRELCGIGPEVPLLVYSGAAAPQRGMDIMVEALPRLDGVHVAFVVSSDTDPYVRRLVARAAALGVADRLHVLPYVPHDQVVRFLSGADAGVIPIHHWPNHEIALITKFFEYAHARLPMVVSDVRTMAETVKATGNGEVFRAEDLDDFVRATAAVLADPARYRDAYDKPDLLDAWTWERQAAVLEGVYRALVPAGGSAP